MVEHLLAKEKVASSNLVFRSIFLSSYCRKSRCRLEGGITVVTPMRTSRVAFGRSTSVVPPASPRPSREYDGMSGPNPLALPRTALGPPVMTRWGIGVVPPRCGPLPPLPRCRFNQCTLP